MKRERIFKLLSIGATGFAVLVIVGVLMLLRTPSGFYKGKAVVQDLRIVDEKTETWRPYERHRRFEVELAWQTSRDSVQSGWAEVSPFEYGHLRRGQRVGVYVRPEPPVEVRLEPQTAYEVFLVVLGALSFIGLFVTIWIARRLEARNTPSHG